MENFENEISEILEVKHVNEEDVLESFECWDSLTLLSILAWADQKHKINISASEVIDARTIGGLKTLLINKSV